MKRITCVILILALFFITAAYNSKQEDIIDKDMMIGEVIEKAPKEASEEVKTTVVSAEIEEQKTMVDFICHEQLNLYDVKMELPQNIKDCYHWLAGGRYIFDKYGDVMMEIASIVPSEEDFLYANTELIGITESDIVLSDFWKGEAYRLQLNEVEYTSKGREDQIHCFIDNGVYKIHAIAYGLRGVKFEERTEIFVKCLDSLRIRESLLPQYGDMVELARNAGMLEQCFSDEEPPNFGEFRWYAVLAYECARDVDSDFVIEETWYSKQETVENIVIKYFDVKPEDVRKDNKQYDVDLKAYKHPNGLGGFSPSFQIASAEQTGNQLKLQVELYNEDYEMYSQSNLQLELYEEGLYRYISNVVLD